MKVRDWLNQIRKEEYEYWCVVFKYAKKTTKKKKAKKMVKHWENKLQQKGILNNDKKKNTAS